MRFGVCTSPDNATVIAAAGFDYIELGITAHLKPASPEGPVLRQIEESLEHTGIRPEAFNSLLPSDVKIVGPVVDLKAVIVYLDEALYRASRLGGQVVVFGSGNARRVPEGFSQAKAESQIVDFLVRVGDLAGTNNLVIAIEPLNTSECNIINSVAEARAIAQRVAHPHIKVLSDLFHVGFDRQPYDETIDVGKELAHVHVAGKHGRMAPKSRDVDYLGGYFHALRKAGYDGRVSIESGWSDLPSEAAESLLIMRQAWKIAAFGD